MLRVNAQTDERTRIIDEMSVNCLCLFSIIPLPGEMMPLRRHRSNVSVDAPNAGTTSQGLTLVHFWA
jgi:hypothetical protein